MQYRTLGGTGYSVSEIGLGAWAMGSQWGPIDDDESVRTIKKAIELGCNFIDTAFAYGEGRSERVINRAFREVGKRVPLATKIPPKNRIWPSASDMPLQVVYPRWFIRRQVETSLKNLETDCIDLIQLHTWTDRWCEETDWLEESELLKKEGKIKYFGVSLSESGRDGIEVARKGMVDTVQVIYNVFNQHPRDWLFPHCQKNNTGVIARVPFDESSLTGKFTENTTFPKDDFRHNYFRGDRLKQTVRRVEPLKEILIRDEIQNLAVGALKFCLSHPAVSTVIPGIRTVQQAEINCSASDGKLLKPEELETLKEHAWDRNFYE